jgi:hypothetical protein
MEIRSIDLDWCKVFDTNLSHHCRIDTIYFCAFSLLMIPALNHIKEDDLLYISKNNNQIVSEEFNRLNFSLISIGEHYRSSSQFLISSKIINEHFVREFFIKNCSQMNILSSIVVEIIGSKINDSKINMRSISTLYAMNFWCEGYSYASTEVSSIFSILSINEYLSLITMIVLLLTKECIFIHAIILIPPID